MGRKIFGNFDKINMELLGNDRTWDEWARK